MVKKTQKLLLFSVYLILLFFAFSSSAFAMEIVYPSLPGVSKPTAGNLPSYVAYLFGLIIYLAGIIAIISFAIGAIEFTMAGVKPSMATEGKERMKSSLIGLVLTLAAALILQTINPQLAQVTITSLAETDGIYYTNGSEYISAPTSEPDTSTIPDGYKTLIYKCSQGPALLIWEYPKINFSGNNDNYGGVNVKRIECGATESLSAKSFQLTFETSGIYYCMGGCGEKGSVCSGYMSGANASSGILPEPFKGNLKSVRIVNDIAGDKHYGVVFHDVDDPTATGKCSQPVYSTDTKKEIECFSNIPVSTSSSVFFWNYKDYKTAGQGINFYSEPFGWASGARAGTNELTAVAIKNYWTSSPEKLTFSYAGIDRLPAYKSMYKDFKTRSGSIKVRGNYFMILWSDDSCQTFFQDIVNLKNLELTATVGDIEKIEVFPTK